MPTFPTSSSSSLLQATLYKDFLIIGGGISGLAAAYALLRSGHRVTVLEKGDLEQSRDGHAFRMPPNMTKIFYRWGLGKELRAISTTSKVMHFIRYDTGEMLGSHAWSDDYLNDAGGDFLFAHAADLRNLLYKLALDAGADIRRNSEVTSIDVNQRTVTITSGETFSADILIGADGSNGICRTKLVTGRPDRSIPSGLVVYSCLIPASQVRVDPDLMALHQDNLLYALFGHRIAALEFKVGREEDVAFLIYAPDEGRKNKVTMDEFCEIADRVRQPLRRCLRYAVKLSRSPMEERPELEDWVHESCPFLLIGDAAHPMPAGAIQTASMAIEDAAVLGKLFAHLSNEEQIRHFLYAFQELRQARCSIIAKQEISIIHFGTLPNGEHQSARDMVMRNKTMQGLGVFGGNDRLTLNAWKDNTTTFSYDAEDDADNWWVQWGRLRERARYLAAIYSSPKY